MLIAGLWHVALAPCASTRVALARFQTLLLSVADKALWAVAHPELAGVSAEIE